MAGAGVLLDDVMSAQSGFEAVASAFAAGQSHGVDHAVVGQRGGRDSLLGNGCAECGDNDRRGDAGVGADVQGVAGAVVEPADDFHAGAGSAVGAGESVVGEVRLPGLVGHYGLEPDVGGLGSLLGLRGDQPGGYEVSANRRAGEPVSVAVLKVPGDGVGSGIEAGAGQLAAQLHHQLDNVRCGGARGGLWPP